MSQDATNLEILAAAGTPKQKKHAARIMPIRKNGHLLLTSLLLTNTVLNETLPILCDGLFGKGTHYVWLSGRKESRAQPRGMGSPDNKIKNTEMWP